VQVTSEIIDIALEYGVPKSHLDVIANQMELKNSPRLGVSKYTTSLQVNLSSPKERSEANNMQSTLGTAGAPHIDQNDAWAGLTCMLILSLFAATTSPGIFCLPEIGVCAICCEYLAVVFSGRRFHSGSAPQTPLGIPPQPWESRITLIGYPNDEIINGSATLELANYQHHCLTLPPDYTSTPVPTPYSKTDYTNFSRDGIMTMGTHEWGNFMSRSFFLLLRDILSQCPDDDARLYIDPDRFMSSFFHQKENKRLYDVSQWDLAPGRIASERKRKTISKEYESLTATVKGVMPQAYLPEVTRSGLDAIRAQGK
jgi:hypothetical protein